MLGLATLQVINHHAKTRKVNLVWSCRDPGLVQFYLEQLAFTNSAWNLIYYTGKEPLLIARDLPANVLLLKGRPELDHTSVVSMDTVRWIIYGIETGEGLPEDMIEEALDFEYRARALDEALKSEPQDPEDLFWKSLQRLFLHYTAEELWEMLLQSTASRSHIDAGDFAAVLREIVVPERFTDDLSPRLVLTLDVDGDGCVTWDDFAAALDNPPTRQLERIEQLVHSFASRPPDMHSFRANDRSLTTLPRSEGVPSPERVLHMGSLAWIPSLEPAGRGALFIKQRPPAPGSSVSSRDTAGATPVVSAAVPPKSSFEVSFEGMRQGLSGPQRDSAATSFATVVLTDSSAQSESISPREGPQHVAAPGKKRPSSLLSSGSSREAQDLQGVGKGSLRLPTVVADDTAARPPPPPGSGAGAPHPTVVADGTAARPPPPGSGADALQPTVVTGKDGEAGGPGDDRASGDAGPPAGRDGGRASIWDTIGPGTNRRGTEAGLVRQAMTKEEFLLAVGGRGTLASWGVLYCGGSEQVVAMLRAVCREYGIRFHPEKFDW